MKYDIVIIGAGPAGLRAAEILGRAGKNVVVFEKNKIIGQKVCAGGLTQKSLKFIDKNLIEKSFNSVVLNSVYANARIKQKNIASTIKRADLGQWQLKKAREAGAKIKTSSFVKKIGKNFVLMKGKKIKFDYLIGADGANSVVRKFLGLKAEKMCIAIQYDIKGNFKDMEIFFHPVLFKAGYAWIFPHKGFASIGCGTYIKNMKAGVLKQNFHYWLRKNKIDFSKSKLGACLINWDYKGYEFGNIFLAGDAAGFALGLTGEGIYSALLSGEEIAEKIINPRYKCDKLNCYLKNKKNLEKNLPEINTLKYSTRLKLEIGMFLLKFRFFSKKLVKYVL